MDGAALLATFLEKVNLSPAELARKSGGNIDESDLSRWLRREARPGLDKAFILEELTERLGTKVVPPAKVPAESWVHRKTRKRRSRTSRAA
jgi:hypothetical protein